MESPEEVGKHDYSDTWILQEKAPHIKERIKSIMSKQGFWTKLEPYESGLRLYHELRKNFKVYILSKAIRECSLSWKEKVDWLHKYLGNSIDEIMLVTDKSLVYGDLMYDDLPENGHAWLARYPKGRMLMPKRRYNYNRTNGDNRITIWDDTPISLPINDFGDCIQKFDFSVPKAIIQEVLGHKLERGFDLYN